MPYKCCNAMNLNIVQTPSHRTLPLLINNLLGIRGMYVHVDASSYTVHVGFWLLDTGSYKYMNYVILDAVHAIGNNSFTNPVCGLDTVFWIIILSLSLPPPSFPLPPPIQLLFPTLLLIVISGVVQVVTHCSCYHDSDVKFCEDVL